MTESLYEQLTDLKATVRSLLSAERAAIFDGMTAELERSGILDQVLRAGDSAPLFQLPDGEGKLFHSADALAVGPLVIKFFQGRWSPYDNIELEALQGVHPRLSAQGATLVAISPQTQKHTYMTKAERGLRFPVLSDFENRLARQFGLVYRFTAELQALYESMYTKLPLYNGEPSWQVPLPATFVISHDGKLLYSHAFCDYTRRPEPAELVTLLPQGNRLNGHFGL